MTKTPGIFRILILVIAAAMPPVVLSQCPTGSVLLTSQADVDSFGTNWPGCSEIDGDLTINPASPTPIADLTPLSGLVTINGALRIATNPGGTGPASLDGLQNITSVESLIIGPELSSSISIGSLAPLEGISGSLDQLLIRRLGIADLGTDFSGVTEVRELRLENCTNLDTAPSFPNLTTVRNLIYRSLGIEELALPANLETVNFASNENIDFLDPSGIDISSNSALHTLHSEAPFTYVYDFLIFDNPELDQITGFEALTEIGLFLNLRGGRAGMFDAFHQLTFINGTNLHLFNLMVEASIPELYIGLGDQAAELTVGGPGIFNHLQIWADSANSVVFGASLSELSGDVLLSSASAVSISGFDQMVGIGGDLTFETPQLASLPDFSSLLEVGGDIHFNALPLITDFSGLSALSQVGGSFRFGSGGSASVTSALESLNGLQNLSFASEMRLAGLPNLSDISAIAGAQFDVLKLINLPVLNTEELSFSSVEFMETLELRDISGADLPHFPLLNSVSELIIDFNEGLTSIDAFPLLGAAGSLDISNNQILTTINCNSEITISGQFTLTGNALFDDCLSPCVCALATQSLTTNISDNGANCVTSEDILSACLLSAESIADLGSIRVWVNESGQLRLQTPEGPLYGDLRIYDISGRSLYSHPLNGIHDLTMPIPALSSGIYLISIQTSAGIRTEKIFR